jgi:hypothetical protein
VAPIWAPKSDTTWAFVLADLLPGDPWGDAPAMTVRTEGNMVQSLRSPSERNDAQHGPCEEIIVHFRIIENGLPMERVWSGPYRL